MLHLWYVPSTLFLLLKFVFLEQTAQMEYGDTNEDTDFGALQQGFVRAFDPRPTSPSSSIKFPNNAKV